MNEFNKMLQGELYNPSDPELVEMRLKARQTNHMFNQIESEEARTHSLEYLFDHMGENVTVYPSIRVEYGVNITIGDNFFSDFNCKFLDANKITIGNNVNLGSEVSLITNTRPLDPQLRIQGMEIAKPIVLKDNVWIGPSATILGGVTLGENVVVGAGSVVTQDFPANVLVSGIPAKIVQEL